MNLLRTKIPGLVVFALVLGMTMVGEAGAQVRSRLVIPPVDTAQAEVAENPLVKNTSDVMPVLEEANIPGNSGVLFEAVDGRPIVDSYSDYSFNPASNVKIAMAFAVLKVFGPEYRFVTNIWIDGTIDRETNTLNGDVYVSGRDPMFQFEHAVTIARELNRFGIINVTGNLYVTDNFSINQSGSAVQSAGVLLSTLKSSTRSAAASRAWSNFLSLTGISDDGTIPTVIFSGNASVASLPATTALLFSHESVPLRDIVKNNLCFSTNPLSERLGAMVGGPQAVARLVHQHAGVAPEDFVIQTASGLGVNRVTPRAMMRLLRALRDDLAKYEMTFADIMPVAAVDQGTLSGRFGGAMRGSVVGKTGTLGITDSGVSSLAGEINTKNGPVLFVIFNQRGSVPRFRSFQNSYVSSILEQEGGPVPMRYTPSLMATRLVRSRVIYPTAVAALN